MVQAPRAGLPLYRQAEIYACNGIDLDRSNLGHWMGQTAALVRPRVEAVGAHVMAAEQTGRHTGRRQQPVISGR